jgi:hypothetical protein
MQECRAQKVGNGSLKTLSHRLAARFFALNGFAKPRDKSTRNTFAYITTFIGDARDAIGINAEVTAQKRGDEIGASFLH